MDRPWVKEIQQETDPVRIIVLWLATGRTILDRIAPLMRVVRGATSTEEEVAAQWDTNQAQTRTANGFLADLLARRGALRPGLDVEQARDIAFVLSNAETYLQFTDVCEWTPDEWQERTAALLTAALVA
jgi:hypothetical protein